jgi:hypothetical protein
MNLHQYSYETQCQLILCCFVLHNFIRLHALEEDIYYEMQNEEHEVLDIVLDDQEEDEQGVNDWRDHIAQEMWMQYVAMRQLQG